MTAAKSTLDPAVLNYRATNIIVLVSAEAQKQTYPKILKIQDLQFFQDHQSIVLSQRILSHLYIYL